MTTEIHTHIIKLLLDRAKQAVLFLKATEIALAQYAVLMIMCDDGMSRPDRLIKIRSRLYAQLIKDYLIYEGFSLDCLVLSTTDPQGGIWFTQQYTVPVEVSKA
jgi:hypothetical protein